MPLVCSIKGRTAEQTLKRIRSGELQAVKHITDAMREAREGMYDGAGYPAEKLLKIFTMPENAIRQEVYQTLAPYAWMALDTEIDNSIHELIENRDTTLDEIIERVDAIARDENLTLDTRLSNIRTAMFGRLAKFTQETGKRPSPKALNLAQGTSVAYIESVFLNKDSKSKLDEARNKKPVVDHLWDIFESRSEDKTNSIFALQANAMGLFETLLGQGLLWDVELGEIGASGDAFKAAAYRYLDYHKKFVNALRKAMGPYDPTKSKTAQHPLYNKGQNFDERLREDPSFFLRNPITGEMPANVEGALSAAVFWYASNIIGRTLYLNPREVNRRLGRRLDHPVSEDEMTNPEIQGESEEVARQMIGNMAWKALGMYHDRSVPGHHEELIKMALGQWGLETLAELGVIKPENVLVDLAEVTGSQIAESTKVRLIQLERVEREDSGTYNEETGILEDFEYDPPPLYRQMLDTYWALRNKGDTSPKNNNEQEVKGHLLGRLFGWGSDTSLPILADGNSEKPVTSPKLSSGNNSVPQVMADAATVHAQREQKFNTVGMHVMNLIGVVPFLNLYTKYESNRNKIHKDKRQGAIDRNTQLRADVNFMKRWFAVAKDQGFYIPNRFLNNWRNHEDSRLSRQMSKIHRAFVQPAETAYVIKAGQAGQTEKEFLVAVAEKIGISLRKDQVPRGERPVKFDPEALETWDQAYEQAQLYLNQPILKSDGTTSRLIVEVAEVLGRLSDPTRTHRATAQELKLLQELNYNDHEIEAEGFIALMNYGRYLTAPKGTEIEVFQPVQFDAKGAGLNWQLSQLITLDTYDESLNKLATGGYKINDEQVFDLDTRQMSTMKYLDQTTDAYERLRDARVTYTTSVAQGKTPVVVGTTIEFQETDLRITALTRNVEISKQNFLDIQSHTRPWESIFRTSKAKYEEDLADLRAAYAVTLTDANGKTLHQTLQELDLLPSDASKSRELVKHVAMIKAYFAGEISLEQRHIEDLFDTIRSMLAEQGTIDEAAQFLSILVRAVRLANAIDIKIDPEFRNLPGYEVGLTDATVMEQKLGEALKSLKPGQRVGAEISFNDTDIFTHNFKSRLMSALRMTYGSSLRYALRIENLNQDAVRKFMSEAVNIMAIIIRPVLDQKIKEQKMLGLDVGPAEINQIVRSMIKGGIWPTLQTHLSHNAETGLDAMSWDFEALDDVAFKIAREPSERVKKNSVKDNVRMLMPQGRGGIAANVRLNQALSDAVVMILVAEKVPLISTLDGGITSPKLVGEAVRLANEYSASSMLENNIMENLFNELAKTLVILRDDNTLLPPDVRKVVKARLHDALSRDYTPEPSVSLLDTWLGRFEGVVTQVKKAREQAFFSGIPVQFGNFVYRGGEITHQKKGVDSNEKTPLGLLQAEMAANRGQTVVGLKAVTDAFLKSMESFETRYREFDVKRLAYGLSTNTESQMLRGILSRSNNAGGAKEVTLQELLEVMTDASNNVGRPLTHSIMQNLARYAKVFNANEIRVRWTDALLRDPDNPANLVYAEFDPKANGGKGIIRISGPYYTDNSNPDMDLWQAVTHEMAHGVLQRKFEQMFSDENLAENEPQVQAWLGRQMWALKQLKNVTSMQLPIQRIAEAANSKNLRKFMQNEANRDSVIKGLSEFYAWSLTSKEKIPESLQETLSLPDLNTQAKLGLNALIQQDRRNRRQEQQDAQGAATLVGLLSMPGVDVVQSEELQRRTEDIRKPGQEGNPQSSSTPTYGDPRIDGVEGAGETDLNLKEFITSFYNRTTADQVQYVFDVLSEREQGETSPEHQRQLKSIIQRFIIPGIRSIGWVETRLMDKMPTARHGGAYAYDNDTLGKGTVYLGAAGNQLTSNAYMSLEEIAAHEYLHAIIKFALRNNIHFRTELQRLFQLAKDNLTWENLMPPADQIVGDPKIAEEAAKRRWDYIFEGMGPNPLEDFMAIGLTNEPLSNALKTLDQAKLKNKPLIEGTFSERLRNLLTRMLEWLAGLKMKTNQGSVYAGLEQLTLEIVKYNTQTAQKIQRRQMGKRPLLDRLNTATGDLIDTVTRKPIKRLLDRQQGDNWRSNGLRGAVGKVASEYMSERRKHIEQAMDEWYRGIGGVKNNALFEIMEEFKPYDPDKRKWYHVLRMSDHEIEQARRRMAEDIRRFIMEHFDKKNFMNKAERAAITTVVMRTNLQVLLDTNAPNYSELIKLLSDPQYLQAAIQAELRTLNKAVNGNQELFRTFYNQAGNLGYFKIDGVERLEGQMFNATNIVNQVQYHKNERLKVPHKEDAIASVERLSALHAIDLMQHNGSNDIQNALRVFNHEMARDVDINGFTWLVDLHSVYVAMEKKRLHNDKAETMVDGHVYEQYDEESSVRIEIDTPANREALAKEGFFWVADFEASPNDPIKDKRAWFKSARGISLRQRGAISITSDGDIGPDMRENVRLSEKARKLHLRGQTRRLTQHLDTQTKNAARAQRHTIMVQRDYNGPKLMAPVVNEDGEVYTYKYNVPMSIRDNVFGREDYFDRIMPRQFGHLEDVVKSEEHNRNIARMLFDEYIALKNNKGIRFVRYGADSTDPRIRETWNLLPKAMKEEMRRRFGGDYFYIRDDITSAVVGYRKLTVSDVAGKHAFAVRTAERIVQEIMQWTKLDIAILDPTVAAANMVSNIALLLMAGVPPDYIIKEAAVAMRGVAQYRKDLRELRRKQLQTQMDIAKGGTGSQYLGDLKLLEHRITHNPVKSLMDEGIFTTIVEDYVPDETSLRSRAIEAVEDKMGRAIHPYAARAVNEFWMLPGSTGFQVMIAATQYADFVSRHIIYQYETQVRGASHEDALDKALAYFIWYDLPQNMYLQYGGDMGMIMFSKYFFRIQPVVTMIFVTNPATATAVILLQPMLAGMFPQPFEQAMGANIQDYLMLGGFNIQGRLHMFPLMATSERNILTPNLLQAVMWPIGGMQ